MRIFDKLLGRKKKNDEKNIIITTIKDDDYSIREGTTDDALNIMDAYELAHKGVEYEKSGQWNKAIEQYKRAIELTSPNHPNLSTLHTNLGVCYAQIGKIDEAIRELEIALKINPSDERAHENLRAVKQLRGL